MLIPHSSLQPSTLDALIEEFVMREGTDYGEVEINLTAKVSQIRQQLDEGKLVITYDDGMQSCSIIRHSQIPHE